MRVDATEAQISKAVRDLLTLRRVWWMRCQSGLLMLESASGKRRPFRAGRTGMADILALPSFTHCDECTAACDVVKGKSACCLAVVDYRSVPLWIETKTRTGVQSQAQKDFEAEVKAEGHDYMICRSVDEMATKLKEYGR